MHKIHLSETNYCPDYYSRTKGNKEGGMLSEWIKKLGDIELFD